MRKLFKSRHINALVYQFRFSDSYQYMMSENYDIETMESYAEKGDAFANVVLFSYYSNIKQYLKAEKVGLNIYVQTIPKDQYLTFENAMILYSKSEENTAKEAAYLIYLKDRHDGRIDAQRLDFLIKMHGMKKVNNELSKLENYITRLSEKLPENSISWAVKPLHIQKRADG